MERKTFRTILHSFSLLVVLVLPTNIFSCGWSESYETTRLALFRAALPSFEKLDKYIYSSDLYSETGRISHRDQDINCKEWVAKLDRNINPIDVYEILYTTDSAVFQNAIESDSLTSKFKGNSFIKILDLPKNKSFLKYVSIAKQYEYSNEIDGKWESWDKVIDTYGDNSAVNYSEDNPNLDNLIAKQTDTFLKERYAFLNLRSCFYEQKPIEVQDLYDKYFKNNSTTILSEWAKYYMALGLKSESESNYNLSQILVKSDDKANACVQHFNDSLVTQTLALAKNDTEKGIIKSIPLLYNPAPTIENLKEIATLIPENELFSFLVQREINKLEDWIFTPKYSNNSRSDNYADEAAKAAYEKAKLENEQKDLKALQDLKSLLIDVHTKSEGQQKDFLSSAIAQLCFINDEVDEGSKFTNLISANANPSIQVQKNVQLALITLKKNDLKSDETQEKLYNYFNEIEDAVSDDSTLFKSMYSLYGIASEDFYQIKDITTAGLLFMKSENKEDYYNNYFYSDYYYNNKYFYTYVGYFDRNAQTKDIDILIDLAKKSNKTNFERYICSGNIAKDINYYRDLKGTIAFRNNDLELAQKTFAEMPKDFWKKTYEFKNYLNENPFFPKALNYAISNRKYDYQFNKANFVKEMIKLRDSKTASDYLKLANAYYNVSSYGNAWMMTSYEQSGGSYNDYIYGDSLENQKKYSLGNYFYLTLAKDYYQKALQLSKNKEQKAVCSLMIFECDYYNYSTIPSIIGLDGVAIAPKFKPGREIYDFNSIYADTKVFKKFNCPLLEQFIN
jgi:hypothetical protein